MAAWGRAAVAVVAVVLCVLVLGRWSDGRRQDARNLEVVRVLMQAGLEDHLAALGATPRYARPERVERMPAKWAANASLRPTSDLPDDLRPPVVLDGHALWLDGDVLWAQLGDGQLLRLADVAGDAPVPQPRAPLWAAALLAALATAGLGVPYIARLRTLHATAEAVAAGRYEARVADDTRDWLGDLARHHDAMTATLHVHRKERDTFFRAVTHEMGTPLMRMAFALDLAESAEGPDEVTERLDALRRELDALTSLSAELLDFAFESPDRPDARTPIDVEAVLGRVCTQNSGGETAVTLEWADSLPSQLDVDERGFARAIDNLVRNAVRYAEGQVRVSGAEVDGMLEVWVEDDGPGIPEHARQRIFEPFARLDDSRGVALGGAGLGLAIVSRIVDRHAGSAGAYASPALGGAAIVTRWPLARPAHRPE